VEVLAAEKEKDTALVEKVFHDVSGLSREEIRVMISNVQKAVENEDQLEVPIKHYFSKDVYAREMTLPEGALIVGKIHKFENLNILSKGEVSVLSIDGVVKLKAPATFVGSVGAKRVILAHSDVVWTTIHGTSETDVAKIEDIFIAKSYDEVEEQQIIELKQEAKCLG
jgi:cytoskeletal protein CcmA (bactofilin family)